MNEAPDYDDLAEVDPVRLHEAALIAPSEIVEAIAVLGIPRPKQVTKLKLSPSRVLVRSIERDESGRWVEVERRYRVAGAAC